MTLSVKNLNKEYPTRNGPLEILRNCTFCLPSGKSAGILGPSGIGKSTLLNIVGTLESATSGTIELGGETIYSGDCESTLHPPLFMLTGNRLAEFRRHKIGFVFQEHHLLPQCSALENVLIPVLAEGKISQDAKNRAIELLKRVGLSERMSHRPAELSGGEKQRVAVARALIFSPKLILADEPTGNLDRNNAALVADLLCEIRHFSDAMLLLVTHDLSLANKMDFQFHLTDGTLNRVQGSPGGGSSDKSL